MTILSQSLPPRRPGTRCSVTRRLFFAAISRAFRATGWKSVRDCSSPLTRGVSINAPSGFIMAACSGDEFLRWAKGSSSDIVCRFPSGGAYFEQNYDHRSIWGRAYMRPIAVHLTAVASETARATALPSVGSSWLGISHYFAGCWMMRDVADYDRGH